MGLGLRRRRFCHNGLHDVRRRILGGLLSKTNNPDLQKGAIGHLSRQRTI
jgi:hypothetical protein